MIETVFVGGPIWTGSVDQSTGSGRIVEAVAIRDGVVLAAGSEPDVRAAVGPGARVRNLSGRALLPGFIDSHTHFITGGFKLSSVQLRDVRTREEFVERLRHFASQVPAGTWITGGDWDHEWWGGELPTKAWIDGVTPDHPVYVSRLDLHMALANSHALALAGVDRDSAEPPGGVIVRDGSGAPTGVLKDTAMSLVSRAMPGRTEEAHDGALRAAVDHALSVGVTQIHHMGSWKDLATYRRAHERGALGVRVYSVVPMATWERLHDEVAERGWGDVRLWWGGLKAFVDGSLGSTTAWFHDPYDDAHDTVGLAVTDLEVLSDTMVKADAKGLQLIVHAIGDRANDWLLDAYQRVVDVGGVRDRRSRVEHAQHLTTAALPRFGEHGIIASMQPFHLADDGRWLESRVGSDRAARSYAFASLLRRGARLAFGSDWTVAPLDPILGIDAALTRRLIDGSCPEGWIPKERIPLDEVLRAYTSHGAFAGRSESFSGSIEVGKQADLVLLSGDPFSCSPEEVAELSVDETFVDGESVYRRAGANG